MLVVVVLPAVTVTRATACRGVVADVRVGEANLVRPVHVQRRRPNRLSILGHLQVAVPAIDTRFQVLAVLSAHRLPRAIAAPETRMTGVALHRRASIDRRAVAALPIAMAVQAGAAPGPVVVAGVAQAHREADLPPAGRVVEGMLHAQHV